MLKLIFRRRFSMAHRLISGSSPKCETPHGHNEYVLVELQKPEDVALDGSENMVEVFANCKTIWHKWIDNCVDHAFQLNSTDPLIEFFKEHEPQKVSRLLVTPGDPTTELMCAMFQSKLSAFLNAGDSNLQVYSVTLEETPTNTAKIEGIDAWKLHLAEGEDFWWCRNDMSINDLNA